MAVPEHMAGVIEQACEVHLAAMSVDARPAEVTRLNALHWYKRAVQVGVEMTVTPQARAPKEVLIEEDVNRDNQNGPQGRGAVVVPNAALPPLLSMLPLQIAQKLM